MMTKGIMIVAAMILGGLLISYSPFRLVRKIIYGTPFSHEPDALFPLMLVWFFDVISWLIVFLGAVRLFHVLFPLASAFSAEASS